MKEKTIECKLDTYLIKLECPICHEGHMQYTGSTKDNLYEHSCTNCGNIEYYCDEQYPMIEYRESDDKDSKSDATSKDNSDDIDADFAYMSEAIIEARESSNLGNGPFGAVIVDKIGRIVGTGQNKTSMNSNCVQHAEIMALYDVGIEYPDTDLTKCKLYTTAYPCPLSMCAIVMSGIKEVYYGCKLEDIEKYGFKPKSSYNELNMNEPDISINQIMRDECLKLFSNIDNQKGNYINE